MSRPFRSCAGALALICAAPLGVADESSSAAAEALTLDQALQLALKQNRDIHRGREFQNWVRGKYIEERSGALPDLTLSASRTRAADETQKAFGGGLFDFPTMTTTSQVDVALSQALFTWGQVGAAVRAAKHGMSSAADQLRGIEQAVRRDVTASFYDVLLAKELAAIAQRNVHQKQRHLDDVQRRLALGTVTDYDVLAAEIAVKNAQPAAIRAQNLVQSARDQLRFLLAIEDREIDALGDLAATLRPPPDYDAALATALARRPDVLDQQHRSELQRELVKIARAGDKPRLDLKGGYGWKEWDLELFQASGRTWNAGLYLSFPFFDGLRTRGRVEQALADHASQQLSAAKLRDSIALEVRAACHALDEAAAIVRALSGAAAEAERLLLLAEKGFALGVKTRLDVEDAQLNLMQAQGALAGAQRDYLVAEATFKYVTGVFD